MRYDYRKQRLQDGEVIPLVRQIMASGEPPHIRGHPADRMSGRCITLDDVHEVLRKGSLDETRYENGGWRYRIKLDRTDLSEEHKVVVAIISENSLAVVTTMKQAYRN